jgi:hypothetical protein
MREQQTTSACPHPEAVGKRWGDPISEERQAELQGILDDWYSPGAEHGARQGPFDVERLGPDDPERVPWMLTAADVGWLAACALAGPGGDVAHAQMILRHYPATDLSGLHLAGAKLSWAHLEGAILHEARLEGKRVGDEDLAETLLLATLRGTIFDEATSLDRATFGDPDYGRVSVLGARWGGVHLSSVKWGRSKRKGLRWKPVMLGDEREAFQPKDERGHPKYTATRPDEFEVATPANRQLATALREQSLNGQSAEFAYRAEVCQRHSLWHQRQIGKWLFSLKLAGPSGYGFKLWRILAACGAVLLLFTALYWWLGVAPGGEHGLRALCDAFLVSLAGIHGRASFEQLGQWTPAAWTAAVEAIFGIVVEGVFIAMLIQRFFVR